MRGDRGPGLEHPRPDSLLKNVWFAAWGHAAYKISSEIGMPCRPGALTGRLFQRAPKAALPPSSWQCWWFVEALVEKCPIRQRLRQRFTTESSAPLTVSTAFS